MIDRDGFILGSGVAILKGTEVLLGERSDGQGWCTAGGKMELGELPIETAKRELTEEFGLTTDWLEFLGTVKSSAVSEGELRNTLSYVFTTFNYTGSIRPCGEILNFKWVDVLTTNLDDASLFPPTRKALKLVRDFLQ